MNPLIPRIETAGPEQQAELLMDCAAALWGEEIREVVIRDADLFERICRFEGMLDAQAYESAAMMLVPEGWGWYVEQERPTRIVEASISPPGTEPRGTGSFDAEANSMAMAIAAACLRAKEATNVAQD